jgi:hypothetical protein
MAKCWQPCHHAVKIRHSDDGTDLGALVPRVAFVQRSGLQGVEQKCVYDARVVADLPNTNSITFISSSFS